MFRRFIDRMVRFRVNSKIERQRILLKCESKTKTSAGWLFSAISFVGISLIFPITKCIGNSMSPTIDRGGDLASTDKFTHLIAGMPYEVGEVVIATSPTNKDKSKLLFLII